MASNPCDVSTSHAEWVRTGRSRSYDEGVWLQRFTARRPGGTWSRRNVDLVTELIEAGRMRPSGQREIDAAKADGRWDVAT